MQPFLNDQTQTKIKTFVSQSLKSFHKNYKGFLITYRQKIFMRDCIKIGIFWLLNLFFFGLYLYFINISSTKGYFLKLAQEQLNINNAKSDIIKLEIVKEKKENRDGLTVLSQWAITSKPYILTIPETENIQP